MGPAKSWKSPVFLSAKEWEPCIIELQVFLLYLFWTDIPAMRLAHNFTRTRVFAELGTRPTGRHHPQCTAAELYSDDYFECFVRQNTMTGYHLAGTCRMGAAADNTAVVDPQLRLTPLTLYCYFNPLTPTIVIWLHI